MHEYDKKSIYDAIHEIERDMNKIEYLVKSYKKIIIDNILRKQDVPEMLKLLERLNNAKTPKTP